MSAKVPKSVQAGLEALGKGMGVAAVELWSIFVRQYIVRGLVELFIGVSLIILSVFLANAAGWWSLVPIVIAHGFFYGAIMLLGNPKYYAIQDITAKLKEIKAK